MIAKFMTEMVTMVMDQLGKEYLTAVAGKTNKGTRVRRLL